MALFLILGLNKQDEIFVLFYNHHFTKIIYVIILLAFIDFLISIHCTLYANSPVQNKQLQLFLNGLKFISASYVALDFNFRMPGDATYAKNMWSIYAPTGVGYGYQEGTCCGTLDPIFIKSSIIRGCLGTDEFLVALRKHSDDLIITKKVITKILEDSSYNSTILQNASPIESLALTSKDCEAGEILSKLAIEIARKTSKEIAYKPFTTINTWVYKRFTIINTWWSNYCEKDSDTISRRPTQKTSNKKK